MSWRASIAARQAEWAVSLELLRKKCGSASSDKEFRRLVGVICEEDAEHSHMPDYAVTMEDDKVRFTNRLMMKSLPSSPQQPNFPLLDQETYHDARTIAPGYDVYFLEKEWQRFWYESGQPELKNPDAAFLGFCKSRNARKPNP
jgi:hypothetical protein